MHKLLESMLEVRLDGSGFELRPGDWLKGGLGGIVVKVRGTDSVRLLRAAGRTENCRLIMTLALDISHVEPLILTSSA